MSSHGQNDLDDNPEILIIISVTRREILPDTAGQGERLNRFFVLTALIAYADWFHCMGLSGMLPLECNKLFI